MKIRYGVTDNDKMKQVVEMMCSTYIPPTHTPDLPRVSCAASISLPAPEPQTAPRAQVLSPLRVVSSGSLTLMVSSSFTMCFTAVQPRILDLALPDPAIPHAQLTGHRSLQLFSRMQPEPQTGAHGQAPLPSRIPRIVSPGPLTVMMTSDVFTMALPLFSHAFRALHAWYLQLAHMSGP